MEKSSFVVAAGNPRDRAKASGDLRIDDGESGEFIGGKGASAVEAKPAEPDEGAPDKSEGNIMVLNADCTVIRVIFNRIYFDIFHLAFTDFLVFV